MAQTVLAGMQICPEIYLKVPCHHLDQPACHHEVLQEAVHRHDDHARSHIDLGVRYELVGRRVWSQAGLCLKCICVATVA